MLRKLTSEFLEQSGYFGTCPTDILMGEDAETGRFGNYWYLTGEDAETGRFGNYWYLTGEDAETGRFGNLPRSPSYYVAEAEFELTVNTQTPQPSQSLWFSDSSDSVMIQGLYLQDDYLVC